MKRCDGSPTLKNMSRLFCAILVDTATLQQNETIFPLTLGNLTMESSNHRLKKNVLLQETYKDFK
jgi:hypothetical protein